MVEAELERLRCENELLRPIAEAVLYKADREAGTTSRYVEGLYEEREHRT